MSDIKNVIRKARESKGFSQTDVADFVAKELGSEFSLRQYQRIEAGQFPKYKTDIY